MGQTEKFLFETSFDTELQAQVQGAEKARPPAFNEADMTQAQSAGFAAGHAAGLKETLESAEHMTAEALAGIAAQLEALATEFVSSKAQGARQAIETAVLALRKLFPELARQNALEEIQGLIKECLERLHDEPRVVIRTADAVHDPLRERLGPLAESCGFEGRFVLLADEALSHSDVRVEWADGGAERDTERLWAEIEAVLACYLGQTTPEAPAASEDAPANAQACPEQTQASDPEDAVANDLERDGAMHLSETGDPQ